MRYNLMDFVKIALIYILALSLAGESHGNGYDDYPPDLAWSPVEDVLVAALEDRLVLWTPDNGQIVITEGEVSSPAFTPDGEWVAFIKDGALNYFQVDNPGSLRRPVHTGDMTAVTFDPLGHYRDPVICYTTRFLGSDIFVTPLFSDEVYLLLPENSEARVSAPVISPDGRNIACMNFAMNPTWYEELYIIGSSAPDGGIRAREDTTYSNWGDWHESNPVWVSDRVILFQIGGWDEWELRFLNIESGVEKKYMENASQATAVSDGRLIAFCRMNPPSEAASWENWTSVWIMNRDTGYLRQVSDPEERAVQPALSISSEGRYLAWIDLTPDGEILKVSGPGEFI
jgi:Tol biopolymer transport system component